MTPADATDEWAQLHLLRGMLGRAPGPLLQLRQPAKTTPTTPPCSGHYPVPKDPGQTTSWVPMEAWNFITQF